MKKALLISLISPLILTGCTSENTEYAFSSTDLTPTATYVEATMDTTTEITTVNVQSTYKDTTLYTEPTETTTEVIPDDGQLVRILDYIPDAEIDLRYATTNNFTGAIIYDDPEAYLCYGTVKKLIQVQSELKEIGYRILIWDAYRSTEAQWKLWDTYPDPTFVANPNNGVTSHSRGNTVDISIVYEDGSSVEMPSAFDEFAAIADRDYSDVSETAANNSKLLEEVMYRNGFTGYCGEWWDYSDTNRYEVKPVIRNNDTGDTYLTEVLSYSSRSYAELSDSSQLIVIDSNGYKCHVYLYEKNDHVWNQIKNTSGYVGKNGVSNDKVEGDYCTPAGLFTLGFGFGTEPIETKIEYRLINDNCYWIDDVNSSNYNKWVESENITWNSAEHMIDYPQSYHYGIVINYNTNPIIPNKGSAIFLHCSNGNYTAGCVSISKEKMRDVLQWIDSDLNPVILIV